MKILFASVEVAPFAKVGGLGDVAGSLPKAIKELGHDVRIIMPLWGCIDNEKYNLKDVKSSKISLKFGKQPVTISLKQSTLPHSDVIVYFVENYEHFGSLDEVYPKNWIAKEEQERFAVFGVGSLKLMEQIGFQPDIIHSNDWHTANIPVYLKGSKNNTKFFDKTSVLYTIHNLAYQGSYVKEILEFANIDSKKVFTKAGVEASGNVNWMKGAINYSERINAVSKTYAEEIQTPQFGEGLNNLLKEKNYKLSGILNGIDYNSWNPEKDPFICSNYSIDNLSGKKECKKALQQEFKLEQNTDFPLIGIVSRLVDQKGLDLIANIANELKKKNLQLAILGSGEKKYEDIFKKLNKNTGNIKVFIGYDNELAHKIYAGSDMFLMPSKFEPCGLSQLIALKYGSAPIARKTGGLADTVIDYNLDKDNGNGFVFEKYDSKKLLETIDIAIKTFKNQTIWNQIIKNAMNCEFSWQKSALEYQKLYETMVKIKNY